MSFINKTIYSVSLNLICAMSLIAQVTDCPYDYYVSGDPIIGNNFEAEHLIICDDTIQHALPTTFNAPNIELMPNFNVASSSTFITDTTGCVAECISTTSQCDDPCTSPLSDDTTPNGQRFVKHEVVITFPDNIVVDWTSNTNILSIGNTSYNLGDTFNLYYPKVNPNIYNPGFIKRCLCDKNIFFYSNDNLLFDEGLIANNNSSAGGIREEGGYVSLNYILDFNEPLSPDTISDGTIVRIKDRANINPGTGTKIIAILDSGLDPSLISPNDPLLYFNKGQRPFTCPMDGSTSLAKDSSGWNFVDNNDNLFDDRGHGSLVTLSFMEALNIINFGGANFDRSKIQILTVKVLNECGEGTTYSTVCGLHYADIKGASIINTSWGMYQQEFQLQRAIYEIAAKDTKIVCSAGNVGANLDTLEHFPSGYAAQHEHFLGNPNTMATRIGNPYVYEVTGSCRPLLQPCSIQRVNLPLDQSSNYRDFIFAEPSRNVEFLLPPDRQPSCEIQGTSYAAPVFSAGLYNRLITKSTATKAEMIADSKKIHPNKEQWSYYLNNCF